MSSNQAQKITPRKHIGAILCIFRELGTSSCLLSLKSFISSKPRHCNRILGELQDATFSAKIPELWKNLEPGIELKMRKTLGFGSWRRRVDKG